jgi:hypothetical protein
MRACMLQQTGVWSQHVFCQAGPYLRHYAQSTSNLSKLTSVDHKEIRVTQATLKSVALPHTAVAQQCSFVVTGTSQVSPNIALTTANLKCALLRYLVVLVVHVPSAGALMYHSKLVSSPTAPKRIALA